MDTKSAGGFRAPLRFQHPDSVLNGPGIPHYLDGCLLDFVDDLSVLSDDPEAGTDMFGFSSDFVIIPAIDFGAASTDVVCPFTLTSGTANAPTIPTQPNTVGGVLRVQSANADNDAAIFKLFEAPFKFSQTKSLWYTCRFAVQATNTGEQLLGLVNTGYSPADPATLPTDGFFFSKATAATDFTFNVRKASTSSSLANVLALASVTLTADTFVELSFRIDAGGTQVYVNGKRVGTFLNTDANLPLTTTALQPVTLVATSAAATKYMDLDTLLVAQER